MAHRINERNAGHTTLQGNAKKRAKITSDDKVAIAKILKTVYNAMEFDEVLNDYSDGGRICLMLDPTEMAAIRVMVKSLTGESVNKNDKF